MVTNQPTTSSNEVAPRYIWPLSNTTTPDPMNTSFGPRVNEAKWDFHDGIDLPAPIRTNIYAMRGGTVHRAGSADDQYSSSHVILKVDDPIDGEMYLVHLHLKSIASGIEKGASVEQGQLLGKVGEDDATYPHLHFEFRKGAPLEKFSVHPLAYLPYTNTTNFTAPVLDRFNRLSDLMAARLLFSASSKLEGDLQRVEVDLMNGAGLLSTRVVDFNNKKTIKEGNGDEYIYVNNIGVEGYQKTNMVADDRADLKYGILVCNLPSNCDTLIARVIDIGGNESTSAPITVPNQTALDQAVDFKDGAMPPAGWKTATSPAGSGTTVTNEKSAVHAGSRRMRCVCESTTDTGKRRAAIEYPLPTGRFEWIAEGWFNPTVLDLALDKQVYLLSFLFRKGEDSTLSVAARIRNTNGSLRAGIAAPDGTIITAVNRSTAILTNVWRKWKLHLLRIGTRETTAVLYLDDVEQIRRNWDSTSFEPDKLSAGIGLISGGAKATILTDELRLTEVTF